MRVRIDAYSYFRNKVCKGTICAFLALRKLLFQSNLDYIQGLMVKEHYYGVDFSNLLLLDLKNKEKQSYNHLHKSGNGTRNQVI